MKHILKRVIDITASLAGLLLLSPVLVLITVTVRLRFGSPVLFKQQRPGLGGNAFCMYKFRTMTDTRDANGNLMPDEERLPVFGKFLRSTNHLTIGNNVYLANEVWLNAMGGLTIEDEVVMGLYAVISTGTHGYKNNSVQFGGTVMQPIVIGRGTWLAAHAGHRGQE